MSFKVMADNNENITSSQDGAMYNCFAGGQDFIFGGIGNEMEVSTNTASLTASLATGECIMCGRHISAIGTNTITLPSSTSGNLVLRYDLSSSNIATLTTTDVLQTGNLNDGEQTRDMLLGTFTTTATGVSQYIDKRVVKTSILEGTNARTIYDGSSAPSDTLGKDGDIYIQWQQ